MAAMDVGCVSEEWKPDADFPQAQTLPEAGTFDGWSFKNPDDAKSSGFLCYLLIYTVAFIPGRSFGNSPPIWLFMEEVPL